MKNTKEITAKEMKMVGDEFHTAIGMISRISFQSKTYPSQWKVGKVQTVQKKGKKDNCGNYRPLSMLSIPSKITESVTRKTSRDCFARQSVGI